MRDLRRLLYGMGCAGVGFALGPAGVAAKDLEAGGCAVTGPAVSARALSEDASRPSQRVVSIREDAQHARRWAVMVDCKHPDWPAQMVLLPAGVGLAGLTPVAQASVAATAAAVVIAVRAGATVRLWRRDGVVSMETTGVAEESGGIGKRIRVRLLRHGMSGADTVSYVWGVVRGVGELEIVP